VAAASRAEKMRSKVKVIRLWKGHGGTYVARSGVQESARWNDCTYFVCAVECDVAKWSRDVGMNVSGTMSRHETHVNSSLGRSVKLRAGTDDVPRICVTTYVELSKMTHTCDVTLSTNDVRMTSDDEANWASSRQRRRVVKETELQRRRLRHLI